MSAPAGRVVGAGAAVASAQPGAAALPWSPLVDLHDHLDGGLRPATVIDLARECGYTGLPTTDADDLGRWFVQAADSGSLEQFLQTFAHTVAVLQTPAALERVAAEAVVDLARDGVGWAEIRMAPELCENQRQSMDEAVAAMLAGLRQGERAARAEGHDIAAGLILCAMRQTDRAEDVARVLQRHLDDGVVGFDIAGPEAGFPALRLASAFALVREAGANITVHAGEADGVESIRQALAVGAQRLGHGVRIAQDINVGADGCADLGEVAREVRDRGIALEVCPTSNVQTGAVDSLAGHPLAWLDELGFLITINPDNRLMCGVGVRHEMHVAGRLRQIREAAHRRSGGSRGGDRGGAGVAESAGAAMDARPEVDNRDVADNDAFDVDPATALRWTNNAIDAAFAPLDVKDRLRARIAGPVRSV
ncbi:MAG: adenosine deaminase [Actinomycetales bacterium]|nr:adenosine deaminase [Actinomycetales bacterium]